jgi:hypothetical protein
LPSASRWPEPRAMIWTMPTPASHAPSIAPTSDTIRRADDLTGRSSRYETLNRMVVQSPHRRSLCIVACRLQTDASGAVACNKLWRCCRQNPGFNQFARDKGAARRIADAGRNRALAKRADNLQDPEIVSIRQFHELAELRLSSASRARRGTMLAAGTAAGLLSKNRRVVPLIGSRAS